MELLVVVAVIAIVAGFAVPAVTTMVRGSQLVQGSQAIQDQIALARQTALSRNKAVEVRFYKFADPETPGENPEDPDSGFFRALQLLEVLDNGVALPMGNITRLPINVIMNEGVFSTVLQQRPRVLKANLKQSDPEMPDNKVAKNYNYVALRFMPDGSTDMPLTTPGKLATGAGGGEAKKDDSWYITLHGTNVEKGGAASDGLTRTLPPNYFTLQIDSVTGATRAYRPNIN